MGLVKKLTCDMVAGCGEPVTHIDEKGYVYCAAHGKERRGHGRRCRKLAKGEIVLLLDEKPVRYRREARP